MKISIPILRDSHNSHSVEDLVITGDGSEVTLIIGYSNREITVSARDLARALRAFVEDEPLPDADGWIRHITHYKRHP